jgi:branched-chain amino acid transport system ATP-binding protein
MAYGPGEITSIIGPNGAGKSTLLKTVFGLTKVAKGECYLDGAPVRLHSRELVKRGVVYVPQVRNVFPTLTVRENLAIGTYVKRGPGLSRAIELFAELEPVLNRRAGKLSGGQANMLAVARAMTSNPRVILLDEPTGGLAPLLAVRLWRHLRELADSGIGIVTVEQNVDLALEYSDRVYVMASGRKVHEGTPAQLTAGGWAGVESLFFQDSKS